MDNEIVSNFINAFYGVAASAIAYFFKDRIFELYNSTFYGKLMDEHGFRKSNHTNFYYTGMQKLEHAVPVEDISFVSNDEKYRMHEYIPNSEAFEKVNRIFNYYKLYCKVKGIPLFNGKVARLVGISGDEKAMRIETQELEYFDYIKSHLLADAYFRNFYHFKHRKSFKSFRQYISSKPDLYLKLARTLGVNILVVTKDSKIILQKRSNKTNIYRGTIYPSSSGSLEYKDSIVLSCSSGAIKKIILGKELFEEVAIFPTRIKEMALVGIYEDSYRLRLPDMFFIAALDTSFFEIKERYEKGHSKDSFETEKIIGIGIDEFFNQEEKTLSQPLRVYFREKELILKYLEEKKLY